MVFTTVVFGNINITSPGTAIYTDGNSIATGGLRLFIVPTKNVGPSNGIDIGFTYINQFGIQKTTSVTTAIAPSTTAGTHTQAVLEAGDTGIRDIISITINPGGGNTGDSINLESWNEGLGRSPIPIVSTKSFDRTEIYPETTPEYPGGIPAHIFEPYIGLWKGKFYSALYDTSGNPSPLVPIMYYSDPQIQIPIGFSRSSITAWIPEPVLRIVISKLVNLADNIGARKEIVEWVPEPLTGNDYKGKMFFVFKSWLESVVGQVLSGYVQNVSGEVIKNAFSMILISPPTDTNPSGVTATADVNPDNGLYQAFLKKVIYDKRYIIVKLGIKNIALEGAGIPEVIDGNQQLPIPYNLQFACPIKNCDFTVTRKIT